MRTRRRDLTSFGFRSGSGSKPEPKGRTARCAILGTSAPKGRNSASRTKGRPPAPLIATWLFGTYHTSFAIAAYIAVCAVLSLIATALMTDYTGKDIGGEYHA